MNKKLFSLLAGLLMAAAGYAQSGTTGDLTWEFNPTDSTLTISGSGAMPDYETDSYYSTTPWYEYRSATKTVVIADGVTYIGGDAFWNYSDLSSVTIPNSVTAIGSDAFHGCTSLTFITIPNSVTAIGNAAFIFCSGLRSVNIPEGVTTIDSSAFEACRSLSSVTIPNSVTSIGGRAFMNCSGLTSVNIFGSLTSIGINTFYNCRSLATVNISEGITTISDGMFYRCDSLTSVNIPSSVTTIGSNAFNSCRSLNSITISESVVTIGRSAFSGCSGLSSVTIPNSVTTIGDGAFSNCSGLAEIEVATDNLSYASEGGVLFNKDKATLIQYPRGKQGAYTIPSSVDTIGNSAFSGCRGLTSVTIPSSVTTIGSYAFSDCSGLTSISIGKGLTSVSGFSFSSYPNLMSIEISSENTNYSSENGVLFNKDKTTLIQYPCGRQGAYTIPSSVDTIGSSAFSYCDSLSSVTIPEGVTTIGSSAFSGCSSLTSVTIPNSVTTIGSAFVPIPGTNVPILSISAFFGCSGLAAIEVAADNPSYASEDGVLFNKDRTTIMQYPLGKQGDYTIPSSVDTIGNGAFYRCNVSSVIIPEGVTTIGGGAFYHCYNLTLASIPNSVTTIGSSAFHECMGLSSVIIPEGVTTIGERAFQACRFLTSVTIPRSVTTIGNNAFISCSYLTFVVVKWSTPLSIPYNYNYNVFSDAVAGVRLLVPAGTEEAYAEAPVWERFGYIVSEGTGCSLASLSVSAGVLTPAFHPDSTTYAVGVVPYHVDSIVFTATSSDTAARVSGTGIKMLNVGANSFSIVVKKVEGYNKTYRLQVVRAAAPPKLAHLTVSAGTLTPAFHPDSTTYTVGVPYHVASLQLTATSNESEAEVSGTGEKRLYNGVNIFEVEVENTWWSKGYTVTVTRAEAFSGNVDTVRITDTLRLIQYVHDTVYIYDTECPDNPNPTVVSAAEQAVVKLYPTVTNGELIVENGDLVAGEAIEIYSMSSGALVAKVPTTGEQTTLNLSQLPSGTYVVRVGKYAGKVVKK